MLGVAALAVGGRWGWVAKHPDALWTFVRKGVFIRFDAFAVGLFLALAPKVWPTLARTLAGKRAAMAGLFLTGALGGVYWVEREAGLGEGLFGRVALLFFAPAAMSTSLLFLGRAVTRRRPWVETLSRSSYALYLVHTLFFWPLSQWAWAHPDWSHGVAAWSGAMLGSLGCALAVHRWVEQPLLRWRDRRLPPAYSPGRRALTPGERAYSTLNTTAEGSLR